MKGKNLVILLVAACALGLLAVMTSKKQRATPPDVIGKKVFPQLIVNEVAKIVVTDRTGSTTVERTENEWLCSNLYGYPANFTKLKDLLLTLRELKIGQTVALTDSERKQLALVPPGSTAAIGTGTSVDLVGDSGDVIASLLLGASHEQSGESPLGGPGGYPNGRYISTDGGKTVYLVAETLTDVSAKTTDWIDTQLFNVPSADLTQVTITHTNGSAITLVRNSGGLTLSDLAETEEMDSSKLYTVDGALSYLRIESIADPALSDAALGMTTPSTFVAETNDGKVYTVRLGGSPANGNNRYVRFEVALKPEPPEAGESEQPEDPQDADSRSQKENEVAELNAKLKGWTYLIPSYKAEGLTQKRANLVKEKEQQEAGDQDTENEEN